MSGDFRRGSGTGLSSIAKDRPEARDGYIHTPELYAKEYA